MHDNPDGHQWDSCIAVSFVLSLVVLPLLFWLVHTFPAFFEAPGQSRILARFEDTPPPVADALAKGKEVWLLESYHLSSGSSTAEDLYVICGSSTVSACVLKGRFANATTNHTQEAWWRLLDMGVTVFDGESPKWFGQRDPDGGIRLTTSQSGYTDLSRYRNRGLEGIQGERWHVTTTIVIRGNSWSVGGGVSSKLKFNSFTMPTSSVHGTGSEGKARRL